MVHEIPVKDLLPAICSMKYFSQRWTIVFLSRSFKILYLPLTLKSYKKCSFLFMISFFLLVKKFMFFKSSYRLRSFQNIEEYSIARDSTPNFSSSLNSFTTFILSLSNSSTTGFGIKFYPRTPSPLVTNGFPSARLTLI